jgi:hypothetical protein
MSTILDFGRDAAGYNAYAPAPCQDLRSVSLAAAGNSSFTVPSNYPHWIVSFAYGSAPDVWVAYGASAAAPAGGSFAVNSSELNPASRDLKAGTVVNVLNNGASTIDIGIYMYAKS